MIKLIKETIDEAMVHISALGSNTLYAILVLLLLLSNQYKQTIFLIIALALIYIIAIPLRLIFFKKRPKPQTHKNILEKIKASSMPSTHSSRAALLFLFIKNTYQINIQITILLTIIALLILYSRKYLKKHFLTDIIIGTITGIISYLITNIII